MPIIFCVNYFSKNVYIILDVWDKPFFLYTDNISRIYSWMKIHWTLFWNWNCLPTFFDFAHQVFYEQSSLFQLSCHPIFRSFLLLNLSIDYYFFIDFLLNHVFFKHMSLFHHFLSIIAWYNLIYKYHQAFGYLLNLTAFLFQLIY